MASILSHPAIPLALGCVLGPRRLPPRYWVLGAIASIAPDADVVSFVLRIPYASPFGHRGATHSIVFALAIAAIFTLCEWRRFAARGLLFAYLFIATISHPLIDMLTDGGLGIALLWPFSNERFFFPDTPIEVSPIGAGFFSARGLSVFLSELKWIWLPSASVALASLFLRSNKQPA